MLEENKSWTKSVVSVNLLIFFIYFLLASVATHLNNDWEVAGLAIFFGYMIHAGILVLIALVKFIIWITNREKTNAGQYVLATFFLLLIGFGACTAMLSIMGGLEGI